MPRLQSEMGEQPGDLGADKNVGMMTLRQDAALLPIAIHVPQGGEDFSCVWGVIEHPLPKPGEVGPLMLTTPGYIRKLLQEPSPRDLVTADGRRMFAHSRIGHRIWTWELFPAYFDDNLGPPIIIGKWPD